MRGFFGGVNGRLPTLMGQSTEQEVSGELE